MAADGCVDGVGALTVMLLALLLLPLLLVRPPLFLELEAFFLVELLLLEPSSISYNGSMYVDVCRCVSMVVYRSHSLTLSLVQPSNRININLSDQCDLSICGWVCVDR